VIEALSRAQPSGVPNGGLGELVVGDDELAGVGERHRLRSIQVGREDQRRQPLAEARRQIEAARRAMAQEVNALQRFVQVRQHLVDVAAGPGTPAARGERVHGRPMTPGNRVE